MFCWAFSFPSFVVRPTAKADPNRPPRVRPTDFDAIPSPIHLHFRRILGFVAASRLTQRRCLTALRFRSKPHRTYDFQQTPPRRRTGVTPPDQARFSGPAPLSLRCRVPFVRAPDMDFHLPSVGHAVRTREASLRSSSLRSVTSSKIATPPPCIISPMAFAPLHPLH